MSLMVTIRDTEGNLLLWGTVHTCIMKSNSDLEYILTKIHSSVDFSSRKGLVNQHVADIIDADVDTAHSSIAMGNGGTAAVGSRPRSGS